MVQAILMAKDYDVREIDGNYGTVTANAVKAFQKDRGEVQDGLIGPQTWGAIFGAKVTPAPTPPVFKPYKVKVTTKNGLNVRKEASTSAATLTTLGYGTAITIAAEKGEWGYINNYKGWIHLGYTQKI